MAELRTTRRRHGTAAVLAGASALLAALAVAAVPSAWGQDETGRTADVAHLAAGWLADRHHLSHGEAARRIEAQPRQQAVRNALARELGDELVGTYVRSSDGALVASVSTAAAARRTSSHGAVAQVVDRSRAQLQRVVAEVAAVGRGAAGASWYIDAASATVRVDVPRADVGAFTALQRKHPGALRVNPVDHAVSSFALRGANAISRDGFRCTAGFLAKNASDETLLLTAGHCSDVGVAWRKSDGSGDIGPMTASTFGAGGDYAAIAVTNAAVGPEGVVQTENGTVDITGSGAAVTGQTLCRTNSSGATGCGTVTATGVSVTYGGATVNGLLRTTICSTAGESGGPVYSGNTAYGLIAAGNSAQCGSQTVFVQPIEPVLTAYGLTLV